MLEHSENSYSVVVGGMSNEGSRSRIKGTARYHQTQREFLMAFLMGGLVKSRDWLKKVFGIAAHHYGVVAVVFLNAVLLLLVVNLLAGMWVAADKAARKSASDRPGTAAYMGYRPCLDPVYPGLDRNQIEKLIQESRAQSFTYDPYCQFRDRPFHGTYYNVEAPGFRVVKDQGPWPPSKHRFNIFVFGGSTIFGTRIADYDTIPSHLQEFLAAETGLPVSVYNFGRCAYLSIQERILFEQLILSGCTPNMAIFIDGLNDLVNYNGVPMLAAQFGRIVEDGETPVLRRVCQELPISKVALAVMGNGQAPSGNSEGGLSGSQLAEQVLRRYSDNKRMIEAISKMYGVAPFFVWQPQPIWEYASPGHIFKDFNYGTWPALKPGYEQMAHLQTSQGLGENSLWLGDIQKNMTEPLYVDAVHYSGDMCKMVARKIGTVLMERELVPSAAAYPGVVTCLRTQ
jgi:hypothetical protein